MAAQAGPPPLPSRHQMQISQTSGPGSPRAGGFHQVQAPAAGSPGSRGQPATPRATGWAGLRLWASPAASKPSNAHQPPVQLRRLASPSQDPIAAGGAVEGQAAAAGETSARRVRGQGASSGTTQLSLTCLQTPGPAGQATAQLLFARRTQIPQTQGLSRSSRRSAEVVEFARIWAPWTGAPWTGGEPGPARRGGEGSAALQPTPGHTRGSRDPGQPRHHYHLQV